MSPDLINGLFELVGGVAVALNINAILRDKSVAGFSVVPLIFFTLWGYWNLFFYPSLHQLLSTFGALFTVSMNTVYLYLVFKYRGVLK